MNSIRYLSILLLALLMGVEVSAQEDFNPASPGDPGVPPQKLALVASPADGGTVSGGGRYVPETKVSVTASAKENWMFVSWTDDAGNIVSTSRSFKYEKLAKDETLTANFEFSPGSPADPVPGTQLVYFKLTLQAALDGGTVSGGGKYRAGTSVKLKATCKENFEFSGWVNESNDTVSTAASFNYTTQEFAETLTAVFTFNPNSPADPSAGNTAQRVSAVSTDGGTVTGSGWYLPGEKVTLKATPNPGYALLGWFLDDELYTALPTFNYTAGEESVTFEARFEFNPASPADPATPTDKQYAIYLMSPITYPGRDVDCQVFLSNPYSPLKDMHFNLTFPEGLTPDINNIITSEGMEGYTVAATETGEANVYAVTLLGGTVAPGNKEIFRIHIPIPETTPLGTDYQLKINQVSVTQEDNTTCTTGTRNGRISVYKKGDSNGDGEVNILDCINMINTIHNDGVVEDDSTFIPEVSDVNEDGSCNVFDVIGVVNIIME